MLIATAAAFAITERLKLVKSPVFGTIVSKRLSPTCGCARGKARIRVRLRHGDDVTLTILDGARHAVRTLAAGEYVPRGRASWTWDGSTDGGTRAPDGVYRPEIHLARQHRTILLPNPISLDTHAPEVVAATLSRPTISPDGDHVGDSIKIRYRLDSPAHVLVYLDSRRIVRSLGHQPRGSVEWLGRVEGMPLPPGNYALYLGGSDLAGNVTPAGSRYEVFVRVRYIRLARDEIRVRKPGVRFGVGVDTDARRYWWKLDGQHGVSKGPVLRLHAPTRPGRYRLTVGERRWTSRGILIVGPGR